jgi:hypothetical protein
MAKKKSAPSDGPPAPAAPARRRAARSATPAVPATDESRQSAATEPLHSARDRSSVADAGSTARTPSYDEIAEAAYHRYLKRGGHDGRDFDDWLEAEQELRGRR